MAHFRAPVFGYNDRVGYFYPAGLPRREWLSHYARELAIREVSFTLYALSEKPSCRQLRLMMD